MSEKGQFRKSMFSVQNMEELGRLYESDTPVLAYDFKRRMVEGWTPEHSHHRGQLVALTQGLLIVETENERWLFPSQRCAWTPPNCKHAARSVGGAAGSIVHLSPEMCRGLPKTPCVFNTSQLLFAIVHRSAARQCEYLHLNVSDDAWNPTTKIFSRQAFVRCHAVEPWAQRRAFLDAVAIPPGTKQRLLHRVLGVRQGAEHAVTVDKQFAAMTLDIATELV